MYQVESLIALIFANKPMISSIITHGIQALETQIKSNSNSDSKLKARYVCSLTAGLHFEFQILHF